MSAFGQMPAVSLLLATYEMPHHLELVLAALAHQSFKNFEVMLCDDGSGKTTRDVVARARPKLEAAGISMTHLWQENKGFRKCRLLNEGIRKSRGDVLVFLDGDCIPHRDFMGDHYLTRAEGTYGAGRRVELSKKFSDSLSVKDVEGGFFDRPSLKLLIDAQWGETEHWNRTIRWGRSPFIRKLLKLDRVSDLKGCNFSVFRSDIDQINGFDEGYEGYGREDTDIEIRLQHLGLRIRGLKGIALQYHVWHERRGFTPQNDSLLESARRTRRVRCERGLEGGSNEGIQLVSP